MVSRLSQDLGMNSYPPLPYLVQVHSLAPYSPTLSALILPLNPVPSSSHSPTTKNLRPICLPSCSSLILSILFWILFRPPALEIQGFDYSIECVGMEEAHSGILAV
ncbi:hypothetical protein AMTRI_Chr06g197790 [Amborella trichopoda]